MDPATVVNGPDESTLLNERLGWRYVRIEEPELPLVRSLETGTTTAAAVTKRAPATTSVVSKTFLLNIRLSPFC